MKRNIISIDQEKCNGCGLCVPDCPEGALQIIDGKARLISDLFCDGLGACIKTCPQDAIFIEEREAEPYNERKVMSNIIPQGIPVIRAHLVHLHEHGETGFLNEAVLVLNEKGISVPDYKKEHGHEGHCCPGSAMRDMRHKETGNTGADTITVSSELRQWPVQLKLINPAASYFNNADLLLAADCAPFAYGDFHRKFLKDKIVINFCPKLDPYIDEYVEKLSAILKLHSVRSVTVVRLEVPCCGGIGVVLRKAMEKSGSSIPVKEYVVSVNGDLL